MAALAGWAAAPVMAQRKGPPLNVVLVLADDLGWADTTPYGADLHETPHLERLAKQCVRFTNAYAAGSVCSPTRASIMTGKYPARLGITIWREAAGNPPTNRKVIPPVTAGNLPLKEVTIAEVLHEAGYFTAHVGKWHLGTADYYPETQGFDVNIGGTLWGAPPTYFAPYKSNRKPGATGEFRYVPHLESPLPGEYLTDRLTTEAVKIIEDVKDKPFFLQLAHHAVHTPIEAKADLVARYKSKLKPGMHHQNPTYAAMMRSLDDSVGRVLDAIEKNGLADRTVILFTSDNGGYINQFAGVKVTDNYPLRSGKGSLYEGGVRVPLLIKWPGVTPAGVTCDEPVVSIDFYPTLLEMLGMKGEPEHNKEVDGISLSRLLSDPKTHLPREMIFFHFPHYHATTSPVSMVRARDWKLLEYHEDNHVELYNLRQDPSETRDLASSMPEKASELREQLHAWRKSVKAQMPTPNPVKKSGD